MLKSILAATATAIAATLVAAVPAQATVQPVAPKSVTISTPETCIRFDVRSTRPNRSWVYVIGDTIDLSARVNRGVAAIDSCIDSRQLVLGRQTWSVEDGDTSARMGVTVLRQSRVGQFSAKGRSIVGSVEHYDPIIDDYTGDQYSGVLIQALSGSSWSTVGTANTNQYGQFVATTKLAPGRVKIRVVRPAGITGGVTGATSLERTVTIR